MATLNRAISAHQAGNLSEAQALSKAILAHDKNQFDALRPLISRSSRAITGSFWRRWKRGSSDRKTKWT
jgi:hypothetical protein